MDYHAFIDAMRRESFPIPVKFGICADYFTQHEIQMCIRDSSIVSGEIKYIGTQTKTRDGSVYAETTYQINWPEAVVTYQQFDVRWSFKDIQYSKDFLAEKGKAVEQATE